jgi:hypothetical protein
MNAGIYIYIYIYIYTHIHTYTHYIRNVHHTHIRYMHLQVLV